MAQTIPNRLGVLCPKSHIFSYCHCGLSLLALSVGAEILTCGKNRRGKVVATSKPKSFRIVCVDGLF